MCHTEARRAKQKTSATLSMDADVDEEDFHNAMSLGLNFRNQ